MHFDAFSVAWQASDAFGKLINCSSAKLRLELDEVVSRALHLKMLIMRADRSCMIFLQCFLTI